jgi:thioredoxin reductase (NADPH)
MDGVFVAVGILPNSNTVPEAVARDEGGYLLAGEDGATSVKGIFAAGDIRKKNLRQIVTAVADGANAVTAVQKYLLEK